MVAMESAQGRVRMQGVGPLWLLGDLAPWDRFCHYELNCEMALANMEGPIISETKGVAAIKAGPSLHHKAMPFFAKQMVVTLANNHMMDFGLSGLASTCAALSHAGAVWVGVGETEEVARAPIWLDVGGLRVAVIACCERQFGAATAWAGGVAVLGPWVFEAVRQARARGDVVIVSVHAGVEMLPWPEAWRCDFFRALVDAGANVVHGHHSHVPQAFESYNGALITYGLGNFTIDPKQWTDHQHTKWSMGFEMLSLVKPVQWRMKTLVCDDRGDKVVIRMATEREAAQHAAYIAECNRVLGDEELLEGVRQQAALDLYENIYAPWMKWVTKSGFHRQVLSRRERWIRPLRAVKESLLGESREWRSEVEDFVLRYHVVVCESHREMFGTALGVLGGVISDKRSSQACEILNQMRGKTIMGPCDLRFQCNDEGCQV